MLMSYSAAYNKLILSYVALSYRLLKTPMTSTEADMSPLPSPIDIEHAYNDCSFGYRGLQADIGQGNVTRRDSRDLTCWDCSV